MALAVATLWDGNAGFRCAILGWCQSASAFGRELSLARPGGAARFDLLLLLPPEVKWAVGARLEGCIDENALPRATARLRERAESLCEEGALVGARGGGQK